MFNKGAVIGKFYPFHLGHKYLIDTALSKCRELSIMICWNKNETIAPEVRYQWIRETYPLVRILLVEDEDFDQDDSELWAGLTIKWLGFKPDVVFTSEEYGKHWAKYLKTNHILVDKERDVYSISGTKIRSNPYKYWEYMLPHVRAYFVKRVCIVGAESTGKTTLSRALAEHFKTPWVPEYGRMHWEARLTMGKNFIWDEGDFVKISEEQNKLEDELAKEANKILICDTDAFATSIWFERYMGYKSKALDQYWADRKYDLYILSDPSVPFEDDGTRDGEHLREWMHNIFLKELKQRAVPFVKVSGDAKNVRAAAIRAIEGLYS
jgi:NadR type nicotinamide-nucleotide adenylyltransferase